MRNKIKHIMLVIFGVLAVMPAWADADMDIMEDVEIVDVDTDIETDATPREEDVMDAVSADAVAAYAVDGTLFQRITSLEEEKVILQLEKERAQMELEMERLTAERIKLQMELETLSGRAEQQQQEFENERAKLEAEAARLAKEKEKLEREAQELAAAPVAVAPVASVDVENAAPVDVDPIDTRWRLMNVIGAGNQLQATIEDLNNGQQRRISVGKTVDGFTVQSISLDDGVVFERDGVTQSLNIGNN